ncbi:hypothetical protein JCM24511_07676 [Saitozyma sp. JCM 24511]|nr:hypothetical protein JCM24511_07676 [Saitozyma sp. JCM 24511]
MSSPIPISTNQPTTPPDTRRVSHPTFDKLPLPAHPPGSAHSPSSSLSISPQTPFFPPPGAPLSPLGSSATPTQSGFIKWASGFSLGKSPVSPPLSSTKGFEIPHLQLPSQSHQHQSSASMPASAIVMDEDDHHAHERHDAFEFGDLGDMKNKSWTGATATANRRAVSMSMASGQSASGITSMLRGFGSTSAASGVGQVQHGEVTSPIGFSPGSGTGHGQNGISPPASMPQGGVLADKTAKGQGLLRRFSIGGGFARSPFLSPPSGSSALPPSPPHASMPTAAPAASAPAQSAIPPPPPVHHAVDEGLKPRMTARGRRYSETGARKRGVSPLFEATPTEPGRADVRLQMGERILRDQVHF